jgi:hypothetical protein
VAKKHLVVQGDVQARINLVAPGDAPHRPKRSGGSRGQSSSR